VTGRSSRGRQHHVTEVAMPWFPDFVAAVGDFDAADDVEAPNAP
jgi:hypothetical protein